MSEVEWLDGMFRQSWGIDGGSFTGGPPKGVLHSTETTSWPGYNNGASAPHFTLKPDLKTQYVEMRQHTPLNRAARAMRNESGGVQTNRDSAIQIELVGTTDPKYDWEGRCIYWPQAPVWALKPLRDLMRTLEIKCGIAPVACAPFVPFPHSYGIKASQRMSLSVWDNYSGWCAHQHVPENTHGDVMLDIKYLMDRNAVLPVEIFSPVRVPYVYPQDKSKDAPVRSKAPKWPLVKPYYYGRRGTYCRTGFNGSTDRNNIRTWQKQMRTGRGWKKLDVDGLFGPDTERVVQQFQREKKLVVDGVIGPVTWATAWEAPVT